jgi:hypothetical protein
VVADEVGDHDRGRARHTLWGRKTVSDVVDEWEKGRKGKVGKKQIRDMGTANSQAQIEPRMATHRTNWLAQFR